MKALNRRSVVCGLLAAPALAHAGSLSFAGVTIGGPVADEKVYLTNLPVAFPLELGDTIEYGSRGLFRVTSRHFYRGNLMTVGMERTTTIGQGVMLWVEEQKPKYFDWDEPNDR